MGRGMGGLALLALILGGCGAGAGSDRARHGLPVAYLGVETRLLDDDLVGFVVQMRGGSGQAAVTDYARCAAAQYTLIRGYGFARHVRTHVHSRSSLWVGDAIYTVSPSLPAGSTTIDAEVTVADCSERGIPMV